MSTLVMYDYPPKEVRTYSFMQCVMCPGCDKPMNATLSNRSSHALVIWCETVGCFNNGQRWWFDRDTGNGIRA